MLLVVLRTLHTLQAAAACAMGATPAPLAAARRRRLTRYVFNTSRPHERVHKQNALVRVVLSLRPIPIRSFC